MHAEEAEIVSGAESRDHQALFRLGGSGFLDDILNLIEEVAPGEPSAADRSVERELAFVGGLHRGHRAFFFQGGGQQLCSAGCFGPAEIKVVPDHQQERIIASEIRGTMDSVSIAKGFRLSDEPHAPGMGTRRLRIGGFVAGTNHDRDFLDAG